jgi:hypothetical protein
VFEGYNDWFLPSKDELDLMYKNLKAKGLGEFGNNVYWSSSEYTNKNAWEQNFSNGIQYDIYFSYGKAYPYSVRAVRAF